MNVIKQINVIKNLHVIKNIRRISLEILKKYSSYKSKEPINNDSTTVDVITVTTDYYNNECFIFLYYLYPDIKTANFNYFLKKSDKHLSELNEDNNYEITYDKIEYIIEYLNVLFFTYYDRVYNNSVSPRPAKYLLENTILRLKILNALIHSDIFIFVTQSHFICSNFDVIIKLAINEFEYKLSTGKTSENHQFLIYKMTSLCQYIDTFMEKMLDYVTYNTYDLFIILRRVLYEFFVLLEI